MTSRFIYEQENPGRLKEIIISCDHMDCPTSLNDTTIRDSGGLKSMGWSTALIDGKLRHYCSEHPRN